METLRSKLGRSRSKSPGEERSKDGTSTEVEKHNCLVCGVAYYANELHICDVTAVGAPGPGQVTGSGQATGDTEQVSLDPMTGQHAGRPLLPPDLSVEEMVPPTQETDYVEVVLRGDGKFHNVGTAQETPALLRTGAGGQKNLYALVKGDRIEQQDENGYLVPRPPVVQQPVQHRPVAVQPPALHHQSAAVQPAARPDQVAGDQGQQLAGGGPQVTSLLQQLLHKQDIAVADQKNLNEELFKKMSLLEVGLADLGSKRSSLAPSIRASRTSSSSTSTAHSRRPSRKASRAPSPTNVQETEDIIKQVSKRLANINHHHHSPILKTSKAKKSLKDFLCNRNLMANLTNLEEKDIENKFLAWTKSIREDLIRMEVPDEYQIEVAIFKLPDRLKTLARAQTPHIESWRDLTRFFSEHLLGATSQLILFDRFNKENKKLLELPNTGEFDNVSLVKTKIYSAQAPLLTHLDPNIDESAPQALIDHATETFARRLAEDAIDPLAMRNAMLLGDVKTGTDILSSLNKQRAATGHFKTSKGMNSPLIGLLDTAAKATGGTSKSCVLHKGANNHTSEECKVILGLRKQGDNAAMGSTGATGSTNMDRGGRGSYHRNYQPDAYRRNYQPDTWCSFHNRYGHKTEDCHDKKMQDGRPAGDLPEARSSRYIVATEDGRKCYCRHCAAHLQTLVSLRQCTHCWRHSDARTAQDSSSCSKCRYEKNIDNREFAPPPSYQQPPPAVTAAAAAQQQSPSGQPT